MRQGRKDAFGALGAAAAGAGLGAAVYGTIGGVGIAATGTAVGLTLGPFIAIGAGLGSAAYGLYWLGKQVEKRRSGEGDGVKLDGSH